jgi:hypothetical protein
MLMLSVKEGGVCLYRKGYSLGAVSKSFYIIFNNALFNDISIPATQC